MTEQTAIPAGVLTAASNGREPDPPRQPLTDLGNAERLVAAHGRDLRYVPELGWHTWDGRRWRRDDTGEVVRRMKLTVRAILPDAAGIDDDKERKAAVRHAVQSEAHAKIANAIALAESELALVASAVALDADPWLLNVANGTVHLTIGELVPHDRDDLLTKLAPVPLDYAAAAPRWAEFLDQVFAGDQELADFVQRAVGYSLTGSTREHVLFLLHGSGANGKTTFIETLRALFGDYGQQTPAETFLERRGDGIPNDLARLPGARFVAAVETAEGRRLNETLVKRLTGGDTITARFLRREFFEFRPTFKAWLATNHRPEVREVSEAMWRRIRLIPFTVTIPEHDRDPDLPEKLRKELPGILRWAIDGCLAWQDRGLDAPPAVNEATAAYRAEQDVVGRFLADKCITAPTAQAKASELYTHYGYWCDQQGERDRLTQTALGRRLSERGYNRTRKASGWWWQSLGLLDNEAQV